MHGANHRKVGNLPGEQSSFIGRRRELGELKRRLAESRLVTLTGVGGTGKTRLALRLAAELRRAFRDGVWLIDLTQVHGAGSTAREVPDPDVLAYLVAGALGLRDQIDGPPLRWLAEQLSGRQLLLVLDNCEHLLPASAILADALMRGCPGPRVLATSREPLSIAGELLFAVPPLSAPPPGHRLGPAELRRYEAVELFLARAEAALPSFGLTDDNHGAVADLCHRLDGLPLAIELAAARAQVLAPQQILGRLADRFALLSRGCRGSPDRQRTLRACVDWSFDLCTKPERKLWTRLSVFAGGFELDAVEGACAGGDLPEAGVWELVAGLVDKSILVRDDVGDGRAEAARYRMLATIRHYGRTKLIEAGEELVMRRRHRDWYVRLAARASSEWISDRQAYWVARLGREHPNLGVAMEFCLTEPGEAETALCLMGSLPQSYWPAGGLFGEGRRWLDRALAQATAATALRARALLDNSHLATVQGDTASRLRLLEEGEELARRLGGTVELAHAAFVRGLGALFADDLSVAVEALDRAWTILSEAPELDLDLYLQVLRTFGVAAGLAGDQARAGACVQEMLSIVEPRGEERL
jgi:predicted ATPase